MVGGLNVLRHFMEPHAKPLIERSGECVQRLRSRCWTHTKVVFTSFQGFDEKPALTSRVSLVRFAFGR